MAESRFLIVRLGSLGDIIHTLPAAAALRDSFPHARIDWHVEVRWRQILEGNRDLNEVITFDRSGIASVADTVNRLRAVRYSCALDFQSLYKSALFARAAGAREVVGFSWGYAREPLATLLYSRRVHPSETHKIEQNLALVEAIGAKRATLRFTLPESSEADHWIAEQLHANGIGDFYVVSPGGGWRSKCWPAERYGALHQVLAKNFGWRGIVTFGPGEEALAAEVVAAGGDRAPLPIAMSLPQLVSLLRRAKFFVGADTGPMHLAAALGAPVVALFGPTDPARNGPYSERSIVVRKALAGETTYRRGASYSAAMLRIEVEDVVAAISRLADLR
ncbi:MAG TPA: glycosyltransferase family 9 protein [Candidatus Acidoferrales bacterium]|nr:glycosyltransferase family 9 protein [Candidatus Acidoferrales bacterium]